MFMIMGVGGLVFLQAWSMGRSSSEELMHC